MSKDYDPQMHTAEHVLNQAMIRNLGCGRCFSSHLNAGKSKCDYHFSRTLTAEEARSIEAEVNGILAQNLAVLEKNISRREAEALVDLSKLPASVGPEDPIRIITVGDYDICPCIGAHVASTAEVGRFCIVSNELLPAKDSSGPILRLRFKLNQD
jgi:Ser-tRNA(Ala) deacylase AlaX